LSLIFGGSRIRPEYREPLSHFLQGFDRLANRLVVTMTHTSRDGKPKLVNECSLPLTAVHAVDVVITDLAVFRFHKGELQLTALMPGVTLEKVQQNTECEFVVAL